MTQSGEKDKLNGLREKRTHFCWKADALMKELRDLNKYDNLSKRFELNKRRFFERFVYNLSSEPLFPTRYKQLGISPRIQPTQYGITINCAKRFLRNLLFQEIANVLKEGSMVVLDVGLVSCYTGIICGLYPDQLIEILSALKSVGICFSLEKQFKEMGKPELYNKPYLKICFYSPLFSGGSKAMIEGVVESEAKQAGMTTTQFRKTEDFEGIHVIAKEIAFHMEGTTFVRELRDLYNHVFSIHENQVIIGPTGHQYPVTDKDNFRKVFPNFLQSFEFALLAQSALNTIESTLILFFFIVFTMEMWLG